MHLRYQLGPANVLLLSVRLYHALIEGRSAGRSGGSGSFGDLSVALGFETGSMALCTLCSSQGGALGGFFAKPGHQRAGLTCTPTTAAATATLRRTPR